VNTIIIVSTVLCYLTLVEFRKGAAFGLPNFLSTDSSAKL
jgi:hypothetical protein